MHLELHFVRLHIFSQRKSGLEILGHHSILRLDVLYKSRVELDLSLLLELDVLEIFLGSLLNSSEESFAFNFFGLLFGLVEISIGDIRGIDTVKVDLGRCGDAIGLVESSKRDSVYLVGTSDKQQARFELFQKDNSSSLESSGKNNKDSAWGDASSEFGNLWFLAFLDWVDFDIVSGVHGLGHLVYKFYFYSNFFIKMMNDK